MSFIKHHPPDWAIIERIVRWSLLALGPATLTAFLTSILLKIIDREQVLHVQHPWLFLFLPLAAITIYRFQRPFPQKAQPLAIPGLHELPSGVPRYSTPFIYAGTILTHLLGASAGREGAGFQAAGNIGCRFAGWYGPGAVPRQIVISASIAAAFGAIFGTPIAAAVFALEIIRLDRFPYNALVPCGLGGLAGLGATMLLQTRETQFKYLFSQMQAAASSNESFHLDIRLLITTCLLAVVLGLLSCAFTELNHQVRYLSSRLIQPRWVTPLLASMILAALGYCTPAGDYMGLGILPATPHMPSILSAFQPGNQSPYTWLIKLGVTLLTLAAGFRGGEIVPLLFMSTALAHTLIPLAGISSPSLCALAFVGILAAAANTPLAAIFLSVELFGGQYIVYFTFCCLIAYFTSPPTKRPGKPAIRGVPKVFYPSPDPLLYHFSPEKKS